VKIAWLMLASIVIRNRPTSQLRDFRRQIIVIVARLLQN